jgi:hypothetical protein
MSIAVLQENISALKKQLEWLQYSYEKSKKIGIKETYLPEEFDIFETLSSRFARSIDFLVRKVFRSLDDVEFEKQGTLIDVVNNAHKRGLFESENQIRLLKNIRNDIAHEYVDEGLKNLFGDILEQTPLLISIIKNSIEYSSRYLLSNEL